MRPAKFGNLADIPQKHWMLLDECREYYETDGFIFTHANYQPELPMPEQPSYQLRWALFEPDKMQPHFSGKTVFVGARMQTRFSGERNDNTAPRCAVQLRENDSSDLQMLRECPSLSETVLSRHGIAKGGLGSWGRGVQGRLLAPAYVSRRAASNSRIANLRRDRARRS
jgi:hypothetical protein